MTITQRGPLTGLSVVAAHMSEDHLVGNVVALAGALGWLTHHCRPAHTARGWRTPIQGTAGFPDLILLRGGWQIAAECKTQTGRLTPTQVTWRTAYETLAEVPGGGVRYFVWRPVDLLDGTIRAVLTEPHRTTPEHG